MADEFSEDGTIECMLTALRYFVRRCLEEGMTRSEIVEHVLWVDEEVKARRAPVDTPDLAE